MIAIKTPASFSFVQNPICFEFTTNLADMVMATIACDGQSFPISLYPYVLNETTWKFNFDISNLLGNLVRLTYDSSLTHQVDLSGFVKTYTVTIGTYTFTGKIIPGGLSKAFQKFMIQQETNAFDYRFMNPLANWLFTTRTDANTITLSRKELACMFFLAPNDQEISVQTETDKLTVGTGISGKACMVNLPVWLATLTETAETVWFCVDDIKVIQINITDKFSEESYLIKFRNSLGVYEFIEVVGKSTLSPVPGETTGYKVFDADVQDFKNARLRTFTTNTMDVDTGYKSTEELFFIGDMLSASSAWFINALSKQKCIVTSGNYTMALKSISPESVLLKIEPVQSEQYFTPMNDINTIIEILATEDDEFIITEDNYLIGV